ncbi:hypothetical protein A3Q56_07832 [Intoshia linei]|uniref:Uncharacterized protein n=1 Tax=Intoshia linei TaxID=1819745 RepID=A0A177AR30_9BILA|nr:hypothetical protein A3Q56_07832 [Intoshia linei]
MKKRLFRGINSQRDLGFIKALSSSINNMLSYFNN